MAIGILTRVLAKLIQQHGLLRGVKKAKGLGFRNKDIKDAVSSIGAKRKPKTSFKQRKEDRGYAEAMETDPYLNRRMTKRKAGREYMDEFEAIKRGDIPAPSGSAYGTKAYRDAINRINRRKRK